MQEVIEAMESPRGITRRRMVGFLIAAPTLIAAARWNLPRRTPRCRRTSPRTRSTSPTC